jgi:hypothetical protein
MAKKFSGKKGKKSSGTSPQGFPESAWNKLPENWRAAAPAMKTEELEQDILKSVRIISTQTKDMKEDPKIKSLQDDLKDLKGGYTDLISAERAKLEYCLYIMSDRGIVVPEIETEEESE